MAQAVLNAYCSCDVATAWGFGLEEAVALGWHSKVGKQVAKASRAVGGSSPGRRRRGPAG